MGNLFWFNQSEARLVVLHAVCTCLIVSQLEVTTFLLWLVVFFLDIIAQFITGGWHPMTGPWKQTRSKISPEEAGRGVGAGRREKKECTQKLYQV